MSSKKLTPIVVNDRAVVIGGSIAGMLSARVLAESFKSVTIIETDKLPESAQMRKGVPQSAQPHVLFAKGYRILEDLFPGIGAELSAAGALAIDWPREFHHFQLGGWSQNADSASEIVSFTCSRPLLEWAVRRRLAADFPNVQFVEQQRVTGLLASSKTHVTGVRLRSVRGCHDAELSASLVVDASGRRSQAPQWLESLGFTRPSETVVNPFLGYATRRYREPDGQVNWKVMLISQEPPHGTRLGYLAKIEGGEWIATLGGYGHDFPPLDDAGFLAFARSLPSPKFYEAIASAQPVSPIYAHRATANRMRHYEKAVLPQNFVALGDAVCALCPVYGQGMTVSALSAIVLRDWIMALNNRETDGSFIPARFQKKLAKSNFLHWTLATGQDSRFLTTQGRSEPGYLGGLMSWYFQEVIRRANSDAELHTLFMEIAHLLKSPLALYHPKVILRVLGLRSEATSEH